MATPATPIVEFSDLLEAVRYFLKLANDGERGLKIFCSDGDREVIDLREWSPRVFLNDRASLTDQIEAIEDGRLVVRDRETAIAKCQRRIAELDVFLSQL